MANTEQLRLLPAVDEILQHQKLAAAAATFPKQQLTTWVRQSIDACRQSMLSGVKMDADVAADAVVDRTLAAAAFEDGRRLHPVINATGILLHTNLGRAPLAIRASERMQACSGYANVEMNLSTGKRNKRGERVASLLAELTGAEDAVIANNCAAATMLTLQTMAAGREVIVSRSQLVEIGGGYRLPEVFTASGAILKEVGTTNRTYLRDYENAITENTAALIRVHRSNFSLSGFVTEPDISELAALGRSRNLPVIDDIGSGCIGSLSDFGLDEPTVPGSVAAGADVTLFSGDKLFCGPQAGLVVGRQQWTEALRKNPMMRALRVDKVTMAALEATTEIHLAGTATEELPLLQMLSASEDQVRQRCEQIVEGLDEGVKSADIAVRPCISQIGGGSVPGSEVHSYAVRIAGVDCNRLTTSLRTGTTSVTGRIEDDCVILDLRTVSEDQVAVLSDQLSLALATAIEQSTP